MKMLLSSILQGHVRYSLRYFFFFSFFFWRALLYSSCMSMKRACECSAEIEVQVQEIEICQSESEKRKTKADRETRVQPKRQVVVDFRWSHVSVSNYAIL